MTPEERLEEMITDMEKANAVLIEANELRRAQIERLEAKQADMKFNLDHPEK